MRLVAVPTRRELKPLSRDLNLIEIEASPVPRFQSPQCPSMRFILCGMGMVQTAIALTFELGRDRYKEVILAGVAGVHPKSDLQPGQLIGCLSETYLRLGSMNETYVDLTSKFTLDPNSKIRSSFKTRVNESLKNEIPWRHFGTSDWITASKEDLLFLDQFHPYIIAENMEGASAAHVCRIFDLELTQVRAAVNHLGNRDASSWWWKEADESLRNLGRWIKEEII